MLYEVITTARKFVLRPWGERARAVRGAVVDDDEGLGVGEEHARLPNDVGDGAGGLVGRDDRAGTHRFDVV